VETARRIYKPINQIHINDQFCIIYYKLKHVFQMT
jgi:hypothetical protein